MVSAARAALTEGKRYFRTLDDGEFMPGTVFEMFMESPSNGIYILVDVSDKHRRIVHLAAGEVEEVAPYLPSGTTEPMWRVIAPFDEAKRKHNEARNKRIAEENDKLIRYEPIRAKVKPKVKPSAPVYTVGNLTMARVFNPAGLTDVHDLQAVLDAVEKALELAYKPTRMAACKDQPGVSDAPFGLDKNGKPTLQLATIPQGNGKPDLIACPEPVSSRPVMSHGLILAEGETIVGAMGISKIVTSRGRVFRLVDGPLGDNVEILKEWKELTV